MPSELLAWPGVEVCVVVEKRDFYRQVIVTDNASLVTLSAVRNVTGRAADADVQVCVCEREREFACVCV